MATAKYGRQQLHLLFVSSSIGRFYEILIRRWLANPNAARTFTVNLPFAMLVTECRLACCFNVHGFRHWLSPSISGNLGNLRQA
jgi:hypothetical protein